MRRIAISLLSAIAASQLFSCAGSEVGNNLNEIAVSLGSSVRVLLERDASGWARASVLPAGQNSGAAVRLDFSGEPSYRILKITNGTSYVLRMDARICIQQGEKCAESNVLPVGPRKTSYETWIDPIDFVRLSNFRLDKMN